MHAFLKFLTVICLTSFLMACGGDDDLPVVSADSIQGDWELVSMNMDMATSTEVLGVSIDASMTAASTTADYVLSLDGSSFTTSGEYDYTYSLVVSGQDTIAGDAGIDNISGSGSYTLDGANIALEGSFFSFEFDGFPSDAISGTQVAQLSFDANGQLVVTQDIDEETTVSVSTVASNGSTTSVWKRK